MRSGLCHYSMCVVFPWFWHGCNQSFLYFSRRNVSLTLRLFLFNFSWSSKSADPKFKAQWSHRSKPTVLRLIENKKHRANKILSDQRDLEVGSSSQFQLNQQFGILSNWFASNQAKRVLFRCSSRVAKKHEGKKTIRCKIENRQPSFWVYASNNYNSHSSLTLLSMHQHDVHTTLKLSSKSRTLRNIPLYFIDRWSCVYACSQLRSNACLHSCFLHSNSC